MKLQLVIISLITILINKCYSHPVTLDPDVENSEHYTVTKYLWQDIKITHGVPKGEASIDRIVYQGQSLWEKADFEGTLTSCIGFSTEDQSVLVGVLRLKKPDDEIIEVFLKLNPTNNSCSLITKDELINTVVTQARKCQSAGLVEHVDDPLISEIVERFVSS